MFNRILNAIKSRSRAEWQTYGRERLNELREYLQAHGERAAALGFILGICIVFFYKLALVLACLAVVASQLILILSEPDAGD